MKKLWYSIKPIVYTYTIQYIGILISLIIYVMINNNKDILNNIDTIYKYAIIGVTLTIIPISIYLYQKYKIKEPQIELKKILPMIPLGLSISLFYNMLTINLQPDKLIIDINIIILILYMVILGPVFEELIFRYVALRKAKEQYSEKKAIIIISLVFALMHSGIINIIYAFLIGIILSIIYAKYKNILYPIVIHISANLMSIFITKFNLLALILSTICLTLTCIYLKKINHS